MSSIEGSNIPPRWSKTLNKCDELKIDQRHCGRENINLFLSVSS